MTHKAQTPITKYCPDCQDYLPVEMFGKCASRYDGLTSYCREHQLERDRSRRQGKNREKHNAYMREYARSRAAKKKQQSDLFSAYRPATGPRCKTCGKVLYEYDIKRGECFTHVQARHIEFWNQPVRATHSAASD
jgi:hypothetical protein